MDRYAVVMLGAALGGLARYTAGAWVMRRYGGQFPLGTFVVNVTGSFLIGIIMTVLTARGAWHPNWRLFLVVGVLGGYTTFSSFAYESYTAVRQGSHAVAIFYMVSSVVAGYVAVQLGASLAGRR